MVGREGIGKKVDHVQSNLNIDSSGKCDSREQHSPQTQPQSLSRIGKFMLQAFLYMKLLVCALSCHF